jgi:hypothetical protein
LKVVEWLVAELEVIEEQLMFRIGELGLVFLDGLRGR